jgi:hypothetical protein
MRAVRGKSNPRQFVKEIYQHLLKAVEHRSKRELATSDINDTKWWKYQKLGRFSPDGIQLHEKVNNQPQYQKTISDIMSRMHVYEAILVTTPGAVMRPRQFMENFTTCEYLQ